MVTLTGDRLIRYTLRYTNTGSIDAPTVIIDETVPEHTTFHQAESDSGWDCADGSPAGTRCAFNIGLVAAGSNGQVIISVIVDPLLDESITTITNNASISVGWVMGASVLASTHSSSEVTVQRDTLLSTDNSTDNTLPQNRSYLLPIIIR